MDEELAWGGLTFRARAGTLDRYIFVEVVRRRGYLKHLTPRPSDVWLDGGGHIGTFALTMAPHVARVVSYEPDPENARLYRENARRNGARNVALVEACLAARGGPGRALYRHPRNGTVAHSLIPRKNWPTLAVPAVGIAAALESAGANCLKLDVEGAEAEILPAIRDWSGLRAFCMEFHHKILKDADQAIYFDLIGRLVYAFGEGAVRYNPNPRKSWQTVVFAQRGGVP